MLDYLSDRAGAAARMKSALQPDADGSDIDRVWREVWISHVFDGREPTPDQVKRELYEY
jgi:hypothetical protein